MTPHHNRLPTYLYWITLFFLVLTGFGQMPIFKRYYIADLPGLGWLARFFVTHYMHYLFAAVFIALTAYFIADFLLVLRKKGRLSVSGIVKIFLIAGLIATGVLMVIKNFSTPYFPPVFIIVLDLLHLGLCMALLAISLYTLVFRKPWLKAR